MRRKAYDAGELAVIGTYPAVASFGMADGEYRIPESPRYARPITPRDNFIMMLTGKRPYWIPIAGLVCSDMKEFRPRFAPDAMANHQLFDGEPAYPFDLEPAVRTGWFNVEWVYNYDVRGATTQPGRHPVRDITHWEDDICFPDLDAMDWAGCARNNTAFLQDDRLRELGIQCSFWERLMSLLDVADAAVALIDEEQQADVHRLFDRLADFYIDFIGRMKDCCDIDIVKMHDDWGHQNGPFFSLESAREMIVPYMRRVTDYCHSRGLFFELHSCGRNEKMVPGFIEAGVDFWCGQAQINDLYALAHQYKDSPIAFGLEAPPIPAGADEAEMRRMAERFVKEFRDCRVALASAFFEPMPLPFKDAVYEYSRRIWQDEDAFERT